MGYQTPNIDRIGKEGAMFLSWYGQQSCTAGRAAFITGQSPIRTGLTKVGLPGSDVGLTAKDPSVADVMKSLGYATGQFGKNHLGDRNEFLPCVHGFDEFFGNLYHLNAEEEIRSVRGNDGLFYLEKQRIVISTAKEEDKISARPDAAYSDDPVSYISNMIPAQHVAAFGKKRVGITSQGFNDIFASAVVYCGQHGRVFAQAPAAVHIPFSNLSQ
jgi:arylsulfatase A-like enzyme